VSVVSWCCLDLDAAVGEVVADGVVDEVADEPVDEALVALDGGRGQGGVKGDVAFVRFGAAGYDGRECALVEIDAGPGREPGPPSTQGEERFDEAFLLLAGREDALVGVA